GVTVAWLVGVARHKLADHWRRTAREQRGLAAVAGLTEDAHDPWGEHLNAPGAHAALARLPRPPRAALTLRYLDGLPVAEVAIRQVLLHDPAGNLVELFEPATGYHERTQGQSSRPRARAVSETRRTTG